MKNIFILFGCILVSISTLKAQVFVNDFEYPWINGGDGNTVDIGSITQTITIPSAADNKGRLLILVNRNSMALTLSTNVQGQGTTFVANTNLQMLINGINWIKIN